MQYAEDKEGEPVILHIFPGSDGSFTLYEDEGNNYRYEQGEYLTISLNWKDKENILFIGGQKGSYHGSFAERDFIIRINGQKETVVRYRGDAVEIGLNR